MVFDSESFGSLFRLGGAWGNISGPGLFMAKAFVSGSVAAVAFGFTGAALTAMVYGTAASPFVLAATAGFAAGSIGFYRDGVSRAILALERYPRLLRLHLQNNFPAQRFDLWEERRMHGAEFRKSWVLSNMLIVSWLSAGSALDRIVQQEEDAIVAQAVSEES